MTTLAPQPAPRHTDEDAAMPPRADSAGGLTFDITGSARAGAAYLVLRRRGSEDEVSVSGTLKDPGSSRGPEGWKR
ncbi:hypothetical protein [Streptomyces flaveus]|uniref:hypothetical protein n=1 Tax=Streptomyces flaveus TaxID=66370 RepID=UPI00331FF0CB